MIINRSRFVVSAAGHPELTEEFPHDQSEKAHEAALRLKREHPDKKIRVTQNEDSILVRLRNKGQPDLNATFTSLEEADKFEQQVLLERRQGVFVDYGKLLHTTTADLIRKYMDKELPKLKGGDTYRYFFQGVLDDSEGLMERRMAQRQREIDENGRSDIKRAMRTPMGSLEWIHKPLAQVTGEDIEDWMESRRGDVATSTIWRQYELLRSVFGVATTTWGYDLRVNPTAGVRKKNWNFHNERNRRLQGDEFDRIMKAARAWDAEKSLEHRVQELIRERLANKTFRSKSQRKHWLVATRAEVSEQAQASCVHRPVMEAFILFQLATGARRAESLNCTWRHVYLENKTVFLPETKSGLPRNLALRSDLIELLRELPHEGDLVFGLTVDTCASAWKSILEAAGITEANGVDKLLIHDLRHEAISAVAEALGASGTGVSLLELQAFSGHRDLRMLQRYTHLCMSHLADKLSAAVASGTIKNGRKRWDPKVLKVGEVLEQSLSEDSSRAREASVQPSAPCADVASSQRLDLDPVSPEMLALARALAPVFDSE